MEGGKRKRQKKNLNKIRDNQKETLKYNVNINECSIFIDINNVIYFFRYSKSTITIFE